MPVTTTRTVIGMDIDKKYSCCEAISADAGEVFKEERLYNQKEAFYFFLEDLPRPVRLVMEVTGNWQYFYECWEDLAGR